MITESRNISKHSVDFCSNACAHLGGLYVIQEEVYCRDCSDVIGTVWDEIGADAFDGFHEAYCLEVDNFIEFAPPTLYELDEWRDADVLLSA